MVSGTPRPPVGRPGRSRGGTTRCRHDRAGQSSPLLLREGSAWSPRGRGKRSSLVKSTVCWTMPDMALITVDPGVPHPAGTQQVREQVRAQVSSVSWLPAPSCRPSVAWPPSSAGGQHDRSCLPRARGPRGDRDPGWGRQRGHRGRHRPCCPRGRPRVRREGERRSVSTRPRRSPWVRRAFDGGAGNAEAGRTPEGSDRPRR